MNNKNINMKLLYSLFLLVICNLCFGQQKVHNVGRQRVLVDRPGPMNYINLTGNFGHSFFHVYTTNQIDDKIHDIDKKINGINSTNNDQEKKIGDLKVNIETDQKKKLADLKAHMDASIQTLDSTFTKTVINNVDIIKSQVKVEAIDELKKYFETTLKSEIEKLRKDMQTQIDELKSKEGITSLK